MDAAPHQIHWVRRDVAVAPHVRLAVFEAGRRDPDAPTMLFVHGLGHWTQAAWSAIAAGLQDDYRVVGFDLPGFGESSKPDARYHLRFFTDALNALVERLELRRFALVGHSLGGIIAAAYAGDNPARVDLLALIDPAGFRRSPRLLLHVIGSHPAAWMFRIRPSRRFVRHVLMRATVDPTVIEQAVHERAFRLARDPAYLRAFVRVYWGALGNFLDMRALHERLARYDGPVHLFWGRHDRYVPIAALQHARRVYPHAGVTILEHSAHLPNVEEADIIVARLRELFPAPSRGADTLGTRDAEPSHALS